MRVTGQLGLSCRGSAEGLRASVCVCAEVRTGVWGNCRAVLACLTFPFQSKSLRPSDSSSISIPSSSKLPKSSTPLGAERATAPEDLRWPFPARPRAPAVSATLAILALRSTECECADARWRLVLLTLAPFNPTEEFILPAAASGGVGVGGDRPRVRRGLVFGPRDEVVSRVACRVAWRGGILLTPSSLWTASTTSASGSPRPKNQASDLLLHLLSLV